MASNPSDPPTPDYEDPLDWITGYLMVHSMSKTSYGVTYALWIIIAIFFLIGTVFHLAGTQRPYHFAHWSKWALRRRTWRKHRGKKEAERTGKAHRQPVPLPSNSQLLSLGFIFILVMILSFVGPDYIAPRGSGGSPAQKREVDYEEVERYVARYTISKAWWTVAGRTGLIAYALFPLCILFALKAAPFALFALPYTTQFSFDKLSTMHRWVGRLIWFVTAIHVMAWTVQFNTHKNPVSGRSAYPYAWIYPPFLWGVAVSFTRRSSCGMELIATLGVRLTHTLNRLLPPSLPVQILRNLLRAPRPSRPHNVNYGSDASPLYRMVDVQRLVHLARGKSLAWYMVVLHQRHFQKENPERSS